MARKKIAKRVKQPTLAQELQALKISMNLMGQEVAMLTPRQRDHSTQLGVIRSSIDSLRDLIKDDPDLIERRENSINPEQLNQLYAGVNKIAAYAAAMDETKKTMIKLTSKRIRKLNARVAHLRVRLKRLEG